MTVKELIRELEQIENKELDIVIKGIECCIKTGIHEFCPEECPYFDDVRDGTGEGPLKDALALLKEQEPRLITADDFKNADTWGWIPAWCEEKDGSSYWEMITVGALEETKYQYWTARPTDEQRKAVKWDE